MNYPLRDETMLMTPDYFIDFMETEANRRLAVEGLDIGDKIAWGYVLTLITTYKKYNQPKGE